MANGSFLAEGAAHPSFQMAKRAAAWALALVAATAWAQPAPPIVFGMTFGAPIELPLCTRNTDAHDACITKRMKLPKGGLYSGKAHVELRCRSIPWGSCSFEVEVVEGRLERLEMYTQGRDDQSMALADLRRRFGEPTSMQLREMSNGFGAVWQAVDAQWANRHVLVEFKGAIEGTKYGHLMIETSVGREARAKRVFAEQVAKPRSERSRAF